MGAEVIEMEKTSGLMSMVGSGLKQLKNKLPKKKLTYVNKDGSLNLDEERIKKILGLQPAVHR